MAKQITRQYTNSVKDEVVKDGEQHYNYREIRVQSLLDSRLIYTGKVSGRQYVWDRAGDTVLVLEEDASELLSKRIGKRTCCGEGLKGNQVFQLAN